MRKAYLLDGNGAQVDEIERYYGVTMDETVLFLMRRHKIEGVYSKTSPGHYWITQYVDANNMEDWRVIFA